MIFGLLPMATAAHAHAHHNQRRLVCITGLLRNMRTMMPRAARLAPANFRKRYCIAIAAAASDLARRLKKSPVLPPCYRKDGQVSSASRP